MPSEILDLRFPQCALPPASIFRDIEYSTVRDHSDLFGSIFTLEFQYLLLNLTQLDQCAVNVIDHRNRLRFTVLCPGKMNVMARKVAPRPTKPVLVSFAHARLHCDRQFQRMAAEVELRKLVMVGTVVDPLL